MKEIRCITTKRVKKVFTFVFSWMAALLVFVWLGILSKVVCATKQLVKVFDVDKMDSSGVLVAERCGTLGRLVHHRNDKGICSF